MVKRIPASIGVAILALAAAIGGIGWLTAQAGEERPAWGQLAFAALLAALVLGGILARRRLAWLWGYTLSLFLALLQALTLGGALYQGIPFPLGTMLLLGGVAAALLITFLALGRRSALAWFDLVCPACRTPSRMGADLLFRKAHCRKCGNVW